MSTSSFLTVTPSILSSQFPTIPPFIRTAAFLAAIAPQLDLSVCCGVGFRSKQLSILPWLYTYRFDEIKFQVLEFFLQASQPISEYLMHEDSLLEQVYLLGSVP